MTRAETALLKRLAAGGRLLPVRNGFREEGAPTRRPAIAAARVDALVAAGLLSRAEGGVVATAAAASFLRRADAPGDPFRAQHQTFAEDAETGAVRNRDESPVERLLRPVGGATPFLSPAQGQAAERLRADFERGALQPRVTASWSAAVAEGRRGGAPHGGETIGEAAMAARRRFGEAMAAMGPELSGTVADVCCFLKRLETVEAERGWPARSAKLVLRLGLAALARHYGLAEAATGPARVPIRQAGAPDFRPASRRGANHGTPTPD